MNITKEAAKVEYIVTGEGGLDLRGENLTWGQACERVARAQRDGIEPAALRVTLEQVYNWATALRTAKMDYLLGVPLVISEPSA